MKVLHIDASILGGRSVSREVTAAIVERLLARSPAPLIIRRDLMEDTPPHLTLASLPAEHPASGLAGQLDSAAQAVRNESQKILEEFLTADTIVIGAPMYNFTVPSQLKAWIDRIVVPGKTFAYGATGPMGLVGDKRVIVALARGSFYGVATPAAAAEHAESYLRTVLGFIGIKPTIIVLEGLSRGEEQKGTAIKNARRLVQELPLES
jgi:FMN-dependent NADH-azoreductase